jgi:hypothetical protein
VDQVGHRGLARPERDPVGELDVHGVVQGLAGVGRERGPRHEHVAEDAGLVVEGADRDPAGAAVEEGDREGVAEVPALVLGGLLRDGDPVAGQVVQRPGGDLDVEHPAEHGGVGVGEAVVLAVDRGGAAAETHAGRHLGQPAHRRGEAGVDAGATEGGGAQHQVAAEGPVDAPVHVGLDRGGEHGEHHHHAHADQ